MQQQQDNLKQRRQNRTATIKTGKLKALRDVLILIHYNGAKNIVKTFVRIHQHVQPIQHVGSL